jgi:hypothetical protein
MLQQKVTSVGSKIKQNGIKHNWKFRNLQQPFFFNFVRFYLQLKFIYKVKNNLIKADVISKLNNEILNYQPRSASNFHIKIFSYQFRKICSTP